MTPLQTILNKKTKTEIGTSKTEKSAWPVLFTGADLLVEQGIEEQGVPDVAPGPALSLPAPCPCPTCSCPTFWLDGAPVTPAQTASPDPLAAHLHCGHCRPPPLAAMVRRWLLCVAVKGEVARDVAGRLGGDNAGEAIVGNGGGGPADTGTAMWRFEEYQPRFDLGRRKAKVKK